MSMFPALDEMADDIEIGYVAWKVYMILKRELHLLEPRIVKVSQMAETNSFRKASVIKAINRLVERGYLTEHSRTGHRLRRFTLAYQRDSTCRKAS